VGAAFRDEPDSEPARRLDPDRMREELAALGREGAPEEERPVRRIGTFVAVDADPTLVSRADALIGRLADEVCRGFSIEVRFGTVPAAGFVMPAHDELDTLASTLSHRAQSAAIAGDRVVLLGGEAHSYLKDRDVEIGNQVSIDDPMVNFFFTGLSFSCAVLPAGGDRCTLDTWFEYQELVEMPTVPTGSIDVPDAELPRIAAVQGAVPVDVAIGSWALVSTAPLEGLGTQLVVMVRVRSN
jgi:hypothetical protein